MARVLIVGAGPAGASLAYLLAHRGVEVTLLERQRDFAREFRGEVLMPSGVEALEQMGLAGPFGDVPSRVQPSLSLYLNGRHRFTQDLDLAGFERSATVVSQPGLLEMLADEGAKSPHFRLLRGVSVKELLTERGRVVGVRARSESGEEALRADLVVGADGRASIVRRSGGFAARHVSPPLDVVWCKLPCPEDWRGVRVYAGRGHLLIGYRSWDDRLQLAWVILKGTFGELKSRGIEQWIEEMAQQVSPGLASHLRAHVDAVTRPFLLDAACDCVESWSAPGALVLGDAAHTMSPVGGQGINIALRDAIVAANHLVPVLRATAPDPSAIDAAGKAIERERMPEVTRIQALQALPPKVVLSRAWWGEPVRRLLGSLLSRERIRARAGSDAAIFAFGVTTVTLRV